MRASHKQCKHCPMLHTLRLLGPILQHLLASYPWFPPFLLEVMACNRLLWDLGLFPSSSLSVSCSLNSGLCPNSC